MSRQPRRTTSPVSLFPFLAVLVCAMGALIFLLVVTTRRIRDEAASKAQAQKRPHVTAVRTQTATSQSISDEPDRGEQHDGGPRVTSTLPVPSADNGWTSAPDTTNVAEEKPAGRRSAPSADGRSSPEPDDSNGAEESIADTRHVPSADNSSSSETPEADTVERQELDELKQVVERLEAEREARRQLVRRQDQKIADAEDELAAAQDEVDRTARRLEELKDRNESTLQQIERAETERDQAVTQIDVLQRKIDRLKQERARAASSQFTIVPFDGRSGTTRRPLFIECTNNAIRFLPEDIALTPSDLDGFTAEFNPLLAGTRALVYFWTAWDRVHRQGEHGGDEPYILLLVRPGGSKAYYIARQFLSQLNRPYGYELVESDRELTFDEPHPKAVKACRDAIDQVLSEREELMASLDRHWKLQKRQLKLQDSADGFALEEAHRGPFDAGRALQRPDGLGGPDGSRSAGDSRRAGAGESRSEGDRSRGRADGSRGKPDGSRGGAGGSRGKPDGNQGDGQASGNPTEHTTAPATADHRLGSSTSSSQRYGERPISPDRHWEHGSGGQPSDVPHASRDSRQSVAASRDSTQAFDADREVSTGPATVPRQSTSGRSQQNGRPESSAPYNKTTGTRGDDQSGTRGRNDTASRDRHSGNARNTSRRTTGTASSDQQAGRGTAKDRSQRQPSTGSQRQPSTSSHRHPSAESRQEPVQGDIPSFGDLSLRNSELPRSARGSGGSARHSRGHRWGLSRAGASIGFERKVPIDIRTDRIRVGEEITISVGEGETRDELVSAVMGAIDRHSRSWGRPPENFYWIPAIKFVVAPGGNQHYERLHAYLREISLSSSVTFTIGEPDEP